jgi:DNA-binding GntR family transcriptional regulator
MVDINLFVEIDPGNSGRHVMQSLKNLDRRFGEDQRNDIVVARITRQEIDELFPIMGMLETLAGELASQNMKKRDFKRLSDLHNTMVAHYERGEWAPYIKLTRSIHETLFAVAGNESLTTLYNTIMVRIHSVRYVAKKSQKRGRRRSMTTSD